MVWLIAAVCYPTVDRKNIEARSRELTSVHGFSF